MWFSVKCISEISWAVVSVYLEIKCLLWFLFCLNQNTFIKMEFKEGWSYTGFIMKTTIPMTVLRLHVFIWCENFHSILGHKTALVWVHQKSHSNLYLSVTERCLFYFYLKDWSSTHCWVYLTLTSQTGPRSQQIACTRSLSIGATYYRRNKHFLKEL